MAVDLLLDAGVTLPEHVLREAERAADVLLRLTRQPLGQAVWRDYHAAFWERYSTGTLVPVSELVDPTIGLGYPAEYPGSVMIPPPASPPSMRDERLLALAWRVMADGTGEIVLTDELVGRLSEGGSPDRRAIPPHVEVSARIHAATAEALDDGHFTLTLTPARAVGTLTSRFGPAAIGSNLARVYGALPGMTEGALQAQLSFPALYPHTENVCRIPAYLPHVISLGEHRAAEEGVIIPLHDLAVTATRDRLHLVSMSRRRVVEPQVFHAMALDKQPPPLARFLAHLSRGYAAGWTGFDWGPHAHQLPYLPRVRYGRTVLSPARWHLSANDLPAGEAEALGRWRERWSCPASVELRDDDRTLRLDLTEPAHGAILQAHLRRHGTAVLTEAAAPEDFGWLGGHAHEIAVPMVSARSPAPDPLVGDLPKVSAGSHGDLPGSPRARWLNARLHANPEQQDTIIASKLPEFVAELGVTDYWFVRYRSPGQSDHLRLRLQTVGQKAYAEGLGALGTWADRLRDQGLLGDIVLDTYRPEVGRYGSGAALSAAEDVFVADSRLVAATLRRLPAAVDPRAYVSAHMVAIAFGFLGSQLGADWLADAPVPAGPSAGRAVARQAVSLVLDGTLPHVLGRRSEESWTAWQDRGAALTAYRSALSADADPCAVLESLLHMHHNRALGIDLEGERVCRRLARQAARAWCALGKGGDG